jgi:hypothetical protein
MRKLSTRSAIVVSAVMLVLASCGSGEADTSATTSTAAEATTAVAPTTTVAAADVQPETAVWPFASGTMRFDDPVAAARSFAVDYVGFVDPVVGKFQGGGTGTGEVTVRAVADGPITTVYVRRLTAGVTWWVLGASTPNLQLASPASLTTISSPVTLEGESTAYEATVNVEVRQDGTVVPLGANFVMGGSMGQMGPFSKAVPFDTPASSGGAIVLETLSAEDGAVWEVAVVRVRFP